MLIPVPSDGAWAKPASDLINAVRAAAGIATAPIMTIANAKADAFAARVKAKSEIECADIRQRAFQRVGATEERRQINLESTVQRAALEMQATSLPGDNEPASRIDPDWFAAFAEACQDVSDAELQTIFSRILAGEYRKAGTFSLRTLAFLRTLSAAEARVFAQLARHVWTLAYGAAVFVMDEETYMERSGLDYDNLSDLLALGLIGDFVATRLDYPQKEVPAIATNCGVLYRFQFSAGVGHAYIPCIKMTSLGRELLPLCHVDPSPEYLHDLKEGLAATYSCEMTTIDPDSSATCLRFDARNIRANTLG